MSKRRRTSSSKKGGTSRKRKLEPKRDFPCEFHARIEGRKSDFYVLENLSCKLADNGDDVLFYRLRFTDEDGFPHGNHPFDICLTRIKNGRKKAKQPKTMLDEESMERKEAIRFQVKFPTILHKKVKRAFALGTNGIKDKFLLLPNFQVHVDDSEKRVKAIYFILEDNQLNPSKQHRPKWNLGVDTSYCFEKMFGTRYVPLDFTHPDPSVEVDIPTEKRPQRSARWFNHRSSVSNPDVQRYLRGKVGGSKATKMLGFYKGDGLEGAKEPSHILKIGRIEEDSIVVAYLEYYKRRVIFETGWHKHPEDSDQGSSPDWTSYDPDMSMERLPDWLMELYREAGWIERVMARIKYGNGEAKTSEKDAEFKAGYIPQLYQEMICSDTYWSDLVKMCTTTNEIKCYRVYRQPDFERDYSAAVKKTKEDICSGVPYIKAVDTMANKSVRAQCIKQAIFYNGDNYKPTIIPVHPSVQTLRKYKETINAPPPEPVTPSSSADMEVEEDDEEPIVVSHSTSKPEKRKRDEPAQNQEVVWDGTAYMQSDLWREIKKRTVKINNLMKAGDKDGILEGDLLEDQVADYMKLMKKLSQE